MSLLDEAIIPDDGPLICTITGDAGLGKTTLAASFPNPIFLRAEDGLQSIPLERRPKALPLIKKAQDLWDQLSALVTEDHDYKTLVIDSVSALERLFIDYVMEKDKEEGRDSASINQALGGYGAGWSAVASQHQRVRRAAEVLKNKKGMNVVFICHADTETMDLPDQEPYTRYSLRLNKKSLAPYVDDVNIVGFIRLETFMKSSSKKPQQGEKKKAISDGTRIMVCYATAANISKNRYGITEDLIVTEGENPFTQYIPSLKEAAQ